MCKVYSNYGMGSNGDYFLAGGANFVDLQVVGNAVSVEEVRAWQVGAEDSLF